MSEKHGLRNTIVGGTVAALLASLLLEPVRAFLGGVWRLIAAAPGAIWDVLTTSVPVWALLVVAAVVALIARRTGRRAGPIRPPPVIPWPHPQPDPRSPPELNALEDGIIRLLARADGQTFTLADLSERLRTPQLRVGQALERLEELGLTTTYGNWVHGTQVGLTRGGRDLVIARGDV